jgi:hypothetical protein
MNNEYSLLIFNRFPAATSRETCIDHAKFFFFAVINIQNSNKYKHAFQQFQNAALNKFNYIFIFIK